jgi:hypothetical protein
MQENLTESCHEADGPQQADQVLPRDFDEAHQQDPRQKLLRRDSQTRFHQAIHYGGVWRRHRTYTSKYLTLLITLKIKDYQEKVVTEFTREQAEALTKFALIEYAEHDKLKQKIDMDIRIRPANNNEQQENRRDRSYRIATD